MDIVFWAALLIFFAIGAGASFVSQYATAGKGVEAAAKAEALKQNVQHLRDRNKVRRDTMQERQKILDAYNERKVTGQQVAHAAALDEVIANEGRRTSELRKAILDSEKIITENDNTVADLTAKKAASTGVLLLASTIIGGFTSVLFGFINFLASGTDVTSITASVTVTSSVVVQSLTLGAGWPLVWEKFLAQDKLEAATNAAAARFESSVKVAEVEEV